MKHAYASVCLRERIALITLAMVPSKDLVTVDVCARDVFAVLDLDVSDPVVFVCLELACQAKKKNLEV